MNHSAPIASLALLAFFGLAPAAPPDEPRALALDQPYQMTVVLDVAKHRLLTSVFKEQVKRELQDSLRTAFGDLARVSVVDASDKLEKALQTKLEQVRRDGLQAVLDNWKTLSATKTHFVLIDYTDGQYEVQTRQHDGLTGQASPLVRRQLTSDRQFVARLATFLIDRDFGLVGKAEPGATPKDATIKIKGAALGRPVQRGDVFILIPFIAGSPEQRKAEDLLLVVESVGENKECKARVFDRRAKTMSVKGREYRCLLLSTIKAPLRVELMQGGGGRVANVGVTIRRYGFEGEEGTKQERTFGNEGFLSTEKDKTESEYDRVAFLTIKVGPPTALVPVAIVDERPVRIKVNANPASARDLLLVKKGLWEEKAYETGLMIQDLFRELPELDKKAENREKALKRAKEGLEQSREECKQLAGEREELLKQPGAKPDLSYGDGWIKFLDGSNTRLEAYVNEQERIRKEENDPRKLEYLTLIQQAKLEEGRGEFDKALELYEKALKTSFADAGLKKVHDTLLARWTPKSEDHRRARLYLETQWATLDLVTTDGAMDEATKAFQVYREAGDVLGAMKLRQLILGQGGKLQAASKTLDAVVNEEDKRPLKKIGDLAGALGKFGLAVDAFVQQQSK